MSMKNLVKILSIVCGTLSVIFLIGCQGSFFLRDVRSESILGGNIRDNQYQLNNAEGLAVAKIQDQTFLFVGSNSEDAVNVFTVSNSGSLRHISSVNDAADADYELDGITSLTVTEVAGTSYLFAAGGNDNGVSVFAITGNGRLIHRDSVDDSDSAFNGISVALQNPVFLATERVGNTTFLLVVSNGEDGISVFSVSNEGTLSFRSVFLDDMGGVMTALDLPTSLSMSTIAGTTYVFAGSRTDNGVSMFSLDNGGRLAHIYSFTDDATTLLGDGVRFLATASIGANTFLYASGGNIGTSENGITVFRVDPSASIPLIPQETQAADGTMNSLNQASGLAVAQVDNVLSLLVVGDVDTGVVDDEGVTVFSIASNGTLTRTALVTENTFPVWRLTVPTSIVTVNINDQTYFFTPSFLTSDGGVNAFSLGLNGSGAPSLIENVDSFYDSPQLVISQPISQAVASFTTATYLYVAGVSDNGISGFMVSRNGELDNIRAPEGNVSINDPRDMTIVTIGGSTYLFATSFASNAYNRFTIDESNGELSAQMIASEVGIPSLMGATGITSAEIGGNTYLFFAAYNGDAVSVYLGDPVLGSLSHVTFQQDNAALALDGAYDVATTTITTGGQESNYLFVTGNLEDGVNVFSIADDGMLTPVQTIRDTEDPRYNLRGATDLAVATVDDLQYLFVVGLTDNSISSFLIGESGELTYASTRVRPQFNLPIYGSGLTTQTLNGIPHLIVAGTFADNTVSIWRVQSGGVLRLSGEIIDDDQIYLEEASSVVTAVIDDTPFLYVSGYSEDGVSGFLLN